MKTLQNSPFYIFFLSLISLNLSHFNVALSQTDVHEFAPIVLATGEQRLLSIIDLHRYSLSGASMRSLRPPKSSPDLLLLKAVQVGLSDLWVWKKDGSVEHRPIRVEKSSRALAHPKLTPLLQSLRETEVLFNLKGVILRGEIHTESELTRLASLRDQSEGLIQDETTLSPTLSQRIETQAKAWLSQSPQKERFEGFTFERLDQQLFLKGEVATETEKSKLERLIHSRFPYLETEIESLPENARTLYVKVFLLELQKSGFHQLGLEWPATQDAAFTVTSSGLQDRLSLDLQLHTLAGQGLLHVLSSPELVVKIPGEAELFSGGELPIRTNTRFTSNLNWKPFGLSLKLKATHSTSKRVRLELSTEISHLDSSLATSDGVPGLSSNRMKTHIDGKFGEPLFLSGLIQQSYREKIRGLPVLKDIPILGNLFRSQDYQNDRSELVAVLVPEHSPPKPKMHRFKRETPLGPVPAPRNYLDPIEEQILRDSPDYPWNAVR